MDNVIEWLNENELRAYPLIEGKQLDIVPEDFLLDLMLVVNKSISDLSAVELLNIVKESGGITVEFTDNNFFIPIDTEYPFYTRNNNGSLAVFGEGVKNYLDLSNTAVISCHIPVEPSTVFKFDGAWLGVSSLATYKNYQSIQNSYTPETPLNLSAIGNYQLEGDVELYPGYNYKINFNNDKINMGAGFKLGIAMDCTTEFVERDLKDCDKIISYINGIAPDSSGVFRFTSGENIYIFNGDKVTSDIPDENPTVLALYPNNPIVSKINKNTVFVGLTFLESDLCSPIQLLPTNN
jgi:hypothetical protein